MFRETQEGVKILYYLILRTPQNNELLRYAEYLLNSETLPTRLQLTLLKALCCVGHAPAYQKIAELIPKCQPDDFAIVCKEVPSFEGVKRLWQQRLYNQIRPLLSTESSEGVQMLI